MESKNIDSYLLSLKNLAKGLNLAKSSSSHNHDFEKYLKDTNSNFDNINSKISMDLDKFKQNLINLGAAAFLSQLNQSKIEEKIAAKKEELIKTLGLDEEGLKNKGKDEILELKNILEDLLEQFKKDLLASLQNNSLLQKQQRLSSASQNGSPLSSILQKL